jgi:hypothetical protein
MRTTKHCRQRPAKPSAQGSTAGRCVSAIVVSNFLYINNMELAFNQGVIKKLGKINVESFGLYERN